jgi:long-subunit acyl-CoA synthetase (AMP-forming)
MRTSTIHAFLETAEKRSTQIGLRGKFGGAWREWTFAQYAADVRRAARAFISLGVPAGGAVVILGPNRPEWLIADLGAMAAGAVPAGIYLTSTPDQAAYIAGHCDATVAVVHNAQQLAKLRARDKLPRLARFVLMEGAPEGDDTLTWEQFLALGDADDKGELERRLAAIEPGGTATLIYTSGTTGPPKAVMITHGNLLFISEAQAQVVGLRDDEHMISYLPLSHIAEQVLSIHGPATCGYCISTCESFDQLGATLREVRPTALFGVPRVWEKLQAKMVEAGAQASPLKRKVAAWARTVGLRAGYARQNGQRLPLAYPLAKKLVFSTVKERMGLDRCWFCATGAAPISKSTLEYFLSLDIPIYEVYGMSEVTGPGTLSKPGQMRTGSVGKVVPGTEIKIAADGEILMRGPHVFKGYLKDEAATREALDSDGWMHSGDVGEFDGDGFMRITDRKKDLLKTSGGKFVAPQNLEGLLKGIPGVGQAVVIGDNRKYVVALLTLDPDAAPVKGRPLAEVVNDQALLTQLEEGIKRVNGGLAPYETIKRWKVLTSEFTIESGELTPTMKVKRKVVNQRYAREIESLYADT